MPKGHSSENCLPKFVSAIEMARSSKVALDPFSPNGVRRSKFTRSGRQGGPNGSTIIVAPLHYQWPKVSVKNLKELQLESSSFHRTCLQSKALSANYRSFR